VADHGFLGSLRSSLGKVSNLSGEPRSVLLHFDRPELFNIAEQAHTFVVNHSALPLCSDTLDVSKIPFSRTEFTVGTVVHVDTKGFSQYSEVSERVMWKTYCSN